MQKIIDKKVKTKADEIAIDEGCYWSQEQADRVIGFFETYVTPKFTGQKISLLPWQREWLEGLYGWRLPDHRRRWRKALLTVAKKNGKTLLTSGLCLYELLAAGTVSPLVVSCSTTQKNATQILDEMISSINASDKLKKLTQVRPSTKEIRVKSKGARFSSISNEAGNAEGLNLSFGVADEAHAWQGPKLYRALEYASIA